MPSEECGIHPNSGPPANRDHHAICLRSLKKPPVGPRSSSIASQTAASAACSGGRGALAPPMRVLTHPGHIALILTLRGMFRDAETVSAFSATLATPYAPGPATPSEKAPQPDETLTTRPKPRSCMPGKRFRISKNGPRTITAIASSKPAGSLRTSPSPSTPALLTRISTWPTDSTADLIEASDERSSSTIEASRPSAARAAASRPRAPKMT